MQGLFLTWAHFLGKELFTTCMHASAWNTRWVCLQMLVNGAASSPLSVLGRKGLFSLRYKGLLGNAKGVGLTVSCHLRGGCCGRRGSRGFEAHSNFGTSCPSLISSPSLWLSWSFWFFCSLQPHCEHTRSCTLLGGSSSEMQRSP